MIPTNASALIFKDLNFSFFTPSMTLKFFSSSKSMFVESSNEKESSAKNALPFDKEDYLGQKRSHENRKSNYFKAIWNKADDNKIVPALKKNSRRKHFGSLISESEFSNLEKYDFTDHNER